MTPFPAQDVMNLARAAARRLKSREPDDLASDTVMSALKDWPSFDCERSKLSTWINMIAQRRHIDAGRMASRRIAPESIEGRSITQPVASVHQRPFGAVCGLKANVVSFRGTEVTSFEIMPT